jgi:membrane fusion protein, multidrug efflux system
VSVVTAVAAKGDLPVYLTGLGTVVALDSVTVRTRVDGQLIKVDFREGQLVQRGALLAEIDPRPFEVQLVQAEGQSAKDEASLRNAQIDLQRYRALFAQDAIPKQQLDTQEATINQLQGALKSDQGQIDSARLNLIYSRITAPITGRVGIRLVDPGNIVHASDQNGLVTIAAHQPIGVVFTLPEDSLPPLLQHMRQATPLTIEVWNRDLKSRLDIGTLLTVDNAIDPTTGTIRIKGTFPNAQETLFPNQFVNARLLLETEQGVVIVPAAAIQRGEQGPFVYLVKPDNHVEVRTVQPGLIEGERTSVARGLAPGDTVVVEGVDQLQPGMAVTPRPTSDTPPRPTGDAQPRSTSNAQGPPQANR